MLPALIFYFRIALEILGKTRSQLALHAHEEAMEFADEDITNILEFHISHLIIMMVVVNF